MGSIIIHGHFYQPPRENPWTGTIDRERSALPFHDWNERIHAECYRPNAFARITDSRGFIERIVNSYARISFNFGPTLLNWLEHAHPETHARVIEADRESVREHKGHGNAIAQGYNHAILPLCNERDRITQIRWGIADFQNRFGRHPESLWLPETACNDATLGTMIDSGLLYVILSPTQAERVRALDAERMAGRLRRQHRSAPRLSLFPSRRVRAFDRDLLLRRESLAGDCLRRGAGLEQQLGRPPGARARRGGDGERGDRRRELRPSLSVSATAAWPIRWRWRLPRAVST